MAKEPVPADSDSKRQAAGRTREDAVRSLKNAARAVDRNGAVAPGKTPIMFQPLATDPPWVIASVAVAPVHLCCRRPKSTGRNSHSSSHLGSRICPRTTTPSTVIMPLPTLAPLTERTVPPLEIASEPEAPLTPTPKPSLVKSLPEPPQ